MKTIIIICAIIGVIVPLIGTAPILAANFRKRYNQSFSGKDENRQA
jgi:hypothetical protein